MASKSDTAAVEAEPIEQPEVEAPVDEQSEQVAEQLEHQPEAVADELPAEDAEVEDIDYGAILIPMAHPEGGACDRYETNGEGHLMVPAGEAQLMIEHGFAVVDEA